MDIKYQLLLPPCLLLAFVACRGESDPNPQGMLVDCTDAAKLDKRGNKT